MAKVKKMQSGGKTSLGMKSVKAGFDKNPGVTRADIIVAAKKQAKSGAKVKKAQDGTKAAPAKVALRTAQLKRLGRLTAKNPDKAEKVGSKMVERATRRQRGLDYMNKNAAKMIPETPTLKTGGKARNGKSLSPKGSNVSRRLSSYPKTIGKAKGGMNLGKCRGGCY